ncbi:hypothetical protein LEP1GSC163_3102 [Leptospira santarosai str. CBC379]|uniref:Uncharacterized protein n=1 Tax=Leptospira santarosai str. MOR084 TaxID=1049984 RepID=A0A0E2BN75_9LEPT|nr:hypothetical protein [Leptospira santarosai]EKO32786.1 hypothetical protein LEP1GSC179_3044 [Leptospira santarosai str. MOR084]EKR90161.1 hypothetical protein LEP1GSC163_3102 [Leptospira santarosai str. CBC379]
MDRVWKLSETLPELSIRSLRVAQWIAFQVLRIFDFMNLLKRYPGEIKSFPAPIQKTSSACRIQFESACFNL